jgi:phage terminase large subunit-like protein
VCYERRTHVTKVLDSVFEDQTIFGVIYTIDEGDDPHDPAVWSKANPNFNKSVLPDDMAAASRKAKATPSALNNYLTKRLNVWVSGASAWMNMNAWRQCAHVLLHNDLPQFFGVKAWLGLDLAQKKDFASISLVFKSNVLVKAADGVYEPQEKWCVCTRLYTNQVAADESGNAHLAGWAEEGYVQINDGNVTDFDLIADELRALCKSFDVQEIAFDPALSMYFAGKLIEEGLPLVEIGQRSLFFTPALIQAENLVLEGGLVHDANPCMTWMISNLVVKVSRFNELMAPTKERDENKIDGPIAMLMALGRALGNDGQETSYWDAEE